MGSVIKKTWLVVLLLMLGAGSGEGKVFYSKHQLSLSYWNDNHLLQRYISRFRAPGDDDYMTASFRLQIAGPRKTVWLADELYYSIFTDKANNYRFDLLSWRRSREFRQGNFLVKLGYGGLIRGNFGGGALQNGYHELEGYQLVELPYLNGYRAGILGLLRLAYPLVPFGEVRVDPYFTANLRIGAGPTAVRTGIETRIPWSIPALSSIGSFDLRVGYVNYLWANDLIRPAFDAGIVTGLMWNVQIHENYGLSLWYSENQYGLDDPYYGISLHYSPGEIKFGGFSSVMFP